MIGKGMTAEVYEWGKDRVLKLFNKGFNIERINHEAEVGFRVNQAGIPSPASYGMIDVDGRKGIILQRIFGRSILKHVETEPWMTSYYAKQMADLHFKIHNHTVKQLPDQKEIIATAIKESAEILGDKEIRILAYLDKLPMGTSVCHGDLHFENIIISENGLVAIDWMNAYRGNALGDVARTCLSISSPAIPNGTFDIMNIPFMYGKWLTYWGYMNRYMKLAKVSFENIDAWILPLAAARLKEKIPGEKKWLIETIDRHLKQFKA